MILAGALCLLIAASQPEGPRDMLPGLDELLGMNTPVRQSPTDPLRVELQRLLRGDAPSPGLDRVAAWMEESAQRLSTTGDAGVMTQRLQQDVIRALDEMIAQAEQANSQSSSSGSQSSQQQEQRPEPGRSARNEQRGGENTSDQVMPPGSDGVELSPATASNPAAWGNLPPRVRDALVQGASDSFSAMYRRLTEAYYRRIAEEADQ